ncbi:putative zinc binding dehydrogenase [Aspergillus flavus]|uniref:Zinc binding dehydrogenase n=3 Tax=Aspergillus subgen. Circumdati TaxID=2720871 RepID=A0A7U2QT23_ASPFN|nr:unnamed protein product [Aspergillus oryzae RIB40]EIT73025.1 zinc binding dehydrogenase, putative [Aspergillus oryzae 3.042]KDE84420.1 zinc binding dehydrogenase, putative [Aspergillus oryzae 100-8]QRD81850.1 putative zinc binding dehydrogenase [Aspergillus flavus]BAE57180.1 unnamed protein product [Aspergillus oryzae RIB40]|eukprot:EIT73025.1 zinc binding dehydrogenase, putative [Aspergillus oryzae 3.042]
MTTQYSSSQVVRTPEGQSPKLVRETIPVPSPGPGQVLVKCLINAFGDGTVLGCDIVGALIWGGETKGLGAYSEYCLADQRIAFKVPTALSREDASTISLAAATAWLALFSPDYLNLDRTNAQGTSVLVWEVAVRLSLSLQRFRLSNVIWCETASVGLYSIQIASLYGFDVVTTCSPHNAELVRSYGAKYVFDYKDEKVAEEIRKVAPNIYHVFDTVGNQGSSPTASIAARLV